MLPRIYYDMAATEANLTMHSLLILYSGVVTSMREVTGVCLCIYVVCVRVNLKCDVLPYGLNSVRDELVDNVPRIVGPFSYAAWRPKRGGGGDDNYDSS